MIDFIEYFFFLILTHLVRLLPYRAAGKVGAVIGAATFRLTNFRKAITLDNLSHAFPELPVQERRRIALGAFKSYATALVEMMWGGGQSAVELLKTVRVGDDRCIFDTALAKGKGVLIMSGHYGNWEFLATSIRLHLRVPFLAIAQTQRNKRIDDSVTVDRLRFNNSIVPMHRSVREVLRTLHGNGVVLILGDQSGPKESTFVEFFGRPAATHRGAAAFSLKSGAPIIMVFLVRGPDGVYDATFEEVDRSGIEEYTEENIDELTRRHTAILEKHVRLHPDHWLWMHKRWKHTAYYHSRQTVEEPT